MEACRNDTLPQSASTFLLHEIPIYHTSYERDDGCVDFVSFQSLPGEVAKLAYRSESLSLIGA